MTRHLAIGDIHGCFDALRALVAFVDIHESDIVVTLGDYVDRGPNTRDVIDWLISFGKTNSLVALRGNREVMMLNARINQTDKLHNTVLEFVGNRTAFPGLGFPMTHASRPILYPHF